MEKRACEKCGETGRYTGRIAKFLSGFKEWPDMVKALFRCSNGHEWWEHNH